MDFPQYRKLSNNKAFYEILDELFFNEIQIIGKRALYYEHKAEKYPEILRIKEMLDGSMDSVVVSNRDEFNNLKIQHRL